jgi:hypothetical protein
MIEEHLMYICSCCKQSWAEHIYELQLLHSSEGNYLCAECLKIPYIVRSWKSSDTLKSCAEQLRPFVREAASACSPESFVELYPLKYVAIALLALAGVLLYIVW